jgi:hypothetical protein
MGWELTSEQRGLIDVAIAARGEAATKRLFN